MLAKEDRKEIRHLKRIVLFTKIKKALVFAYCLISLFFYPIGLGYSLSLLSNVAGILIGSICFWIQLAIITNKNSIVEYKLNEYDSIIYEAKFYIINYEALKNGRPIVSSPDFFK